MSSVTSTSELPQQYDQAHAQPSLGRGRTLKRGNAIFPFPTNGKMTKHFESPFGVDIFPADEFGFFEKKRVLRLTGDEFQLPPHTEFFQEASWTIDAMLTLKNRLNATKDLLDDLDLGTWHNHTYEMNPAGLVSREIRRYCKPEYCSQAWCKFTECLFTYDVLPKGLKFLYKEKFLDRVNTLHLCEAPGAFISATNHYLKTNFKDVKWHWTALTLNPHHEGNSIDNMINEDKLILCSLSKWDFFKDNTGNLMSSANITDFLERTKKTSNVYHFVTADGSINCQLNPSEQEATVAHLQFTEIVTALLSLLAGGSFVIKIFTFLECKTICHLYLLACTFKNVHLFKPGTSKEGNSEIYVVCTDFLGPDAIKAELVTLLQNIDFEIKDKALFPLSSIDPTFLDRLLEAATFFTELQMKIIRKNLATFQVENTHRIYQNMKQRRLDVCYEFLELYPVQSLPSQESLFGSSRVRTDASLHTDPRTDKGSYSDRCHRTTLSLQEFLTETQTEINNFFKGTVFLQFAEEGISLSEGVTEWEIKTGKAYENILNSRFCYGKLLSIRQDFRQRLRSHIKDNGMAGVPKKIRHTCGLVSFVVDTVKNAADFNILPEDLTIACFRESISVFTERTDAEVTRKRLSMLIDKIQCLKTGHSLFLCEYPLLTRLHVGLLHALRPHFFRVSVIYNIARGSLGIILYGFNSFREPNSETGKLLNNLIMLKQNLDTSDPENMILEICQMPKIYTSNIFKTYLSYNCLNVCQMLNFYTANTRQSPALAPPDNPHISDSSSSSSTSTSGAGSLEQISMDDPSIVPIVTSVSGSGRSSS